MSRNIFNRPLYFSIAFKFFFCLLMAVSWTMFCVRIAGPWIENLSCYLPHLLSLIIIYSIAIVPGFMYAFLAVSLMLDTRPSLRPLAGYPGLTVLIPAYNEEKNIAGTVASVMKNEYKGDVQIIVIDDGSGDNTLQVAGSIEGITVIEGGHGGKAAALNLGLSAAQHDLIVSLDSDTYLHANALQNLVERLYHDPKNTAAVAGAVLVRNSRVNMLTRSQEWDYFHGIGAIKRMQSMFQGTLVVQGAFSLYRKEMLLEAGGWQQVVGEDIVLTWQLLCKGYRTGFAENAVAFTTVPETYRSFFRQRRRWARGMIEAFKMNPGITMLPRFTTLFVFWNLLFPLLDSIYLFVFMPGIILAFYGYYFIAGPLTLLVIPLMCVINFLMYFSQNEMFRTQGLKVRKNLLGLLFYVIGYQMLLSPASVAGYLSEIANFRKSWGTR